MDTEIFQKIYDEYPANIALLDCNGDIKSVNRGWKQYATRNHGNVVTPWSEINYIAICESAVRDNNQHAQAVLSGLESVFKQQVEQFQYVYPCHSPTHQAWYRLRVLPIDVSRGKLYVVLHEDCTIEVLTGQALEKEDNIDALTGLGNRRGCLHFLKKQWRRDQRYKSELSVLTIEIDDQEKYQQQHCRTLSNFCMRRVTQVIAGVTRRPSDYGARIRGEEFVVILGTTTQRDAVAIAEQLKSSIELFAFQDFHQTPDLRITISVGVSSVTPHRHLSPDDLLDKSCEALHLAKFTGGNTVAIL
jgi:diguanylate cyclase (GGDEF)-like protein